MNDLFFCFETKIQMSILMEASREFEFILQPGYLWEKLKADWSANKI